MGNIPVLVLIGALAFAWTMWAVLFWGSIALIERHNPFNTFRAALGWSGINLAISATLGGIIGVGVLLVWVVFLLRLLLGRYELGALHAVGVVLATVVGPYFVAGAFVAFVGDSAALFLLVLYGVPLGVIAVWLWPRPAPQPPTNLPAARIARLWPRRPAIAAAAAPAAPTASAPTAPTAPSATALPAITPIAPPAGGEPAFLR